VQNFLTCLISDRQAQPTLEIRWSQTDAVRRQCIT